MSFPKFYVTYCVMDTDAGANPFGHACLVFSTQANENEPVSVVDSVGFYSQPSTTTNIVMRSLKSILGLTMDLQEGHGVLQREKLHEIDGNGIHGRSFEATKEQFKVLRRLCKSEIEEGKAAIKHWDEALGSNSNGYTRYIAEKELARQENDQPRLRPFHLEVNLGWDGFDSTQSHICKTRALDLLQESTIIAQEIRNELDGGSAWCVFPRVTGNTLRPIRLVSTGSPERFESQRTGKVFYNRTWKGNSLFFASPLNLDKSTPESHGLTLDSDSFQRMKQILNRIREVEKTLRQAIKNPKDSTLETSLKEQLQRIEPLYELFKNVHDNCTPERLQKNLTQAENYLNIATLSLTPERVDYSFYMRALESVFAQQALLGLTGLIVTAALLSGPVGITLIIGAALYTTYSLYKFYQEQTTFEDMKRSYVEFQATKPTSANECEAVNDSDMEIESAKFTR